MRRGRGPALALLVVLSGGGAAADELVATLSDAEVSITSSFTGSRIVVFGAVEETGDRLPEADGAAAPYGVAVVVEGPPETIEVRRKERVLGIWMNRATATFADAPSYYVVHLSRSLSQDASVRQLAQYRLGIENIGFVRQAEGSRERLEFARAVLSLKAERQLYVDRTDAVEFLAPTVFRTTFFLPATIPTGDYRVGIYLFRGETLLAGNTETLTIVKTGLSAEIAAFAHRDGLLYGIGTVLLGIAIGWIAGVLLKRD